MKKEKIMRQELRRMLENNQSAENIVDMLRGFGMNVSQRSISFILKQECSIEEKIFSAISSLK